MSIIEMLIPTQKLISFVNGQQKLVKYMGKDTDIDRLIQKNKLSMQSAF